MYPTDHQDGRAQTTLDFAIAMGVFLLAVAFVFTFIPSLTSPFIDGNQEQSAIADRVASNLVEGSLANPNEPYILNTTCTTGFFGEDDSATVTGCGYNTDNGDYRQRIGVSERPKINISLVEIDEETRVQSSLCYDKTGETVVTVAESSCDTPYRIGGDSEKAESVTVARRVVSIDGRDATLFVRVW
ncbi:hypothetical protein HWV07_04195 [Natronomonas salina]|uniref:DUF7287 family protein n=1 Tax=Natronomonas salina TaxID=1710540 RepID=UPI0015B634AE|nr:hypothetical protein [Natronomonas salina]QLD88275.1 hypothetical protein HWV07_04195 [Natronomonas salina]